MTLFFLLIVPVFVLAQTPAPTIDSVAYSDSSNEFTVTGQNLTSGSVLFYADTTNYSNAIDRMGNLSYVQSSSFPTKVTFAGSKYTANMAGIFTVKIIDAQGRGSNEMTIDTRTVNQTPAPAPSPVFTAPPSKISPATPINTTLADVDTQNPQGVCLDLKTNLRYRMRDIGTNDDVSVLQDFLQANNYLYAEPTGFFGVLTLQAVKKFQQVNGTSPTGFVGPITRAKIKELSCQ